MTKKLSVFLLSFLVAGVSVFAANQGKIEILDLNGNTTITSGDKVISAGKGSILTENYSVNTKNGTTKTVLSNGTIIFVAENTSIDFTTFKQVGGEKIKKGSYLKFKKEPAGTSSQTIINLNSGRINLQVASLTSKASSFKIITPHSDIIVKGTDFSVACSTAGTIVSTFTGSVQVSTKSGKTTNCVTGSSVMVSAKTGNISIRPVTTKAQKDHTNSISGTKKPETNKGNKSTSDKSNRVDPQIGSIIKTNEQGDVESTTTPIIPVISSDSI